jgi:hypothetical protein
MAVMCWCGSDRGHTVSVMGRPSWDGSMSDPAQDTQREPSTASFEIDGDVEGSTFEDVDSTADKLIKASVLSG